MLKKIHFFIFWMILVYSNNSLGRLTKIEDLHWILDMQKINIKVIKDGNYTETITSRFKILDENGKKDFSIQSLNYNTNTHDFKINYAKSISADKSTEELVALNKIEIKPLASPAMGFDELNQVTIEIPNVEVGGYVEISSSSTTKNAPITDFFNYLLDITLPCENFSLEIESELKLKNINNLKKFNIKLKQSKKGNLFIYNITINRPIYSIVIEEKQSYISRDTIPFILFSSNDKWQFLGNFFYHGYKKVYSQPLPPALEKIYHSAKLKHTSKEQALYVLESIIKTFQYHSNLKTNNSQFFPRDINDLDTYKFGDCKDFSTALTAILRKLNLDAKVAFVYRGLLPSDVQKDLFKFANSYGFNHAIVKLVIDKEVYWIDPTNEVASITHPLSDIADKYTLVLEDKTSHLEQIPAINHEDNVFLFNVERTIDFKDSSAIDQISSTFTGLNAFSLAGIENRYSKQQIEYSILNNYYNYDPTEVINYKLNLPDLTSIAKDEVKIDGTINSYIKLYSSNLGYALKVDYNIPNVYLVEKDRQSSLILSDASTYKESITINNVKIMQSIKDKDPSVYIDNKWFTYGLKFEYHADKITYHRIFINKQSFIPIDELKSKEYQDLIKNLRQNYVGGVVFIINPK